MTSGIDSRRFFTKVRGVNARPPSAVPDPDLVLTSTGLAFSGGKLTSWTANTGPNLSPTVGSEPLDGAPTLNGIAGALFDITGSRAFASSAIIPGTSNTYSFEIVMWPENDFGAGDREDLAYFQNGSTQGIDHLVFPHQANISGFNQLGIGAGNVWHYINTPPSVRPQVLLYTFQAGTARAYRNGVFLASGTGIDYASAFADLNIGGSYGTPPVTQGFEGAIYCVRIWCNVALSTVQAAQSAAPRIAEYALNSGTYYPNDAAPSTITFWCDSRDKRGPASARWDGTASLALWTDQSGHNYHAQQGTGGLRPAKGARINGRPSVQFGASEYMGITPISNLFGAASPFKYSVSVVLTPRSITSGTGPVIYFRDVVIGDAGDYFAIVLFNNAGTPTVGLYHYGLGTFVVTDTGITLGSPVLVHAYYDGTNLSLRVGNRTAVTVPANPISSLTGQMNLGIGGAGSVATESDIAEVLIRNDADTAVMNQDRAYFGRIYNISV